MNRRKKFWATYIIWYGMTYAVSWWVVGVIRKQLHRRR